jgi:hypothetical protein
VFGSTFERCVWLHLSKGGKNKNPVTKGMSGNKKKLKCKNEASGKAQL